jgi:hypothetical protein
VTDHTPPLAPGGRLPDTFTASDALARIDALGEAVTVLLPLVEAHLDHLEQDVLAAAFGLPAPPARRRSGT